MQSLLRTTSPRFMTGIFVAILALTFSSSVFADPTSVVTNPGGNENPSCFALGFSGELRIDPPNIGVNTLIPFVDASGVFLTPDSDANPNLFLNYTVSANGRFVTSWSIVGQYDRLVTAVVVKGGPDGANVYYYAGGSAGDSNANLTIPGTGNQTISHIAFCTEDFIAPTAVMNFSGKVTDKKGNALAGALVTVTDPVLGTTFTTVTNAQGNYAINEVWIEEEYRITASHTRHRFSTYVGFANEGEVVFNLRSR